MRFLKVLIDGGSALNILFAGSLEELGLKKEDLTPMDSVMGNHSREGVPTLGTDYTAGLVRHR